MNWNKLMEFHLTTLRNKHLFTVKRFLRRVHEGEGKGIAFSKTTATEYWLIISTFLTNNESIRQKKQNEQFWTYIPTTKLATRRCCVKQRAIASSERPLKCLRRYTSLFIRLRNLNYGGCVNLQLTKTASEFTWVTEGNHSHIPLKSEILARRTKTFFTSKKTLSRLFLKNVTYNQQHSSSSDKNAQN